MTEETERKQIAAQSIAAALEALKRQAEMNGLSALARLIEKALAEARAAPPR